VHLCLCPLINGIVSSLGFMQEIQVIYFYRLYLIDITRELAAVDYDPIKKIAKSLLDYTEYLNFPF